MENQSQLLKEVTEKAQQWLSDTYDAETRAAVQAMLDDEDKTLLIESFYKDLEFGTGGLRGIMGAGSNRMNIYTVGGATQGLANYLHEAFPDKEEIRVAVGHDVRNNSRKFAEVVANVFSANGIKVFLFESFRPTPELSFAIRKLGCQSGVNITASHNPKEYNGYKAYWEDGAQIIAPHDVNIINHVSKIKPEEIKFNGNPELIQIIGEDVDAAFLADVKALSLDPEVIKRQADLKIVYTPIHGTGVKLIPDSLRNYGFTNIIHVPEQDIPSGDFPTVDSPNPENASAMAMAIEKGKEVAADIILASDPDADRIGCVIRDSKGEYQLINGNQIVMILLNYIMRRNRELGRLKGNEYIVKTIVTTETIKAIAENQGIKMYDCYTGFKWIAREILISEGKKKFIGGGEESFGFLAEDFCRDKDSVSACSLLAEICAWAKDQGKSLYDILMGIYMEYGFSYNKAVNVVRPGKSGADEIKAMMENYRKNPPTELVGSKVTLYKDWSVLEAKDADGKITKLVQPVTSNVLQYFTADGTKLSIRPSGTEPKIKFYIEVAGDMKSPADYRHCCEIAEKKCEEVLKSVGQ